MRIGRAARTRLVLSTAVVGLLWAHVVQAAPLPSSLEEAIEEDAARPVRVWVFFVSRPGGEAKAVEELAALEAGWCERSLWRRAKVRTGRLVDTRDLPVPERWVDRLRRTGAMVRARSRWLNAVSIEAPGHLVRTVAGLPIVQRVARVGRYYRPPVETSPAPKGAATDPLYGPSYGQLEQIQVPAMHADYGLSGQGVRIAFLDSRFDRSHEALQHLKVFAEWDFVSGDPNTAYEEGDSTDTSAGHGTQTLSVAAGYRCGWLLGPAYGAEYVLARTEDSSGEMPVEEDYWVQGLEWAESLGVDIVSSSLGYVNWYAWSDLDGGTAVTTLAAETAAANGVLVVNSAGNEGSGDGEHNTLIAPADGENVLAVGAVRSNGVRVSFSSVGPTADGRVKPDVMAQGSNVYLASTIDVHGYTENSGTSFSAPLVAGLSALLLEAHPEWTPSDVMTALRTTATRAHAPDNRYGWGICQGVAALGWVPVRGVSESGSGSHLWCSNPFRPGGEIRVLSGGRTTGRSLAIYDGLGRLVFATPIADDGNTVFWDATDPTGRAVAPGVYFARLTGQPRGSARKIVLVR